MLPFLKHKDDGVGVGPTESIEREHDEDFDMLGAIAEDLIQAIEKKDKNLLKDALAAFAEHLMDIDEKQDQEMKG